jgi:DNA-binding response OmpR family regulator
MGKMASILVAEDDAALGKALLQLLAEDGYDVDLCDRGDDALALAEEHPYDAWILDVMLPGLDGFSVVEALRRKGHTVPVLMLTAKDGVSDRVRGLNAGADDYLVKPFAAIELSARLRALLRRQGAEFSDPNRLIVGSVTLDTRSRELAAAGEAMPLTPKEAALLELFMRHPGQVLTREQIMARLWGYEGDVLENTLETYVSKLRKRLEREGCPTIQTVRGLGYRLQIDN